MPKGWLKDPLPLAATGAGAGVPAVQVVPLPQARTNWNLLSNFCTRWLYRSAT
ncbi:hypothetical protein D3C72_2102330 [compost metagenome]